MPSKPYHGQFRSRSLRLQNWDYSANAAYFITICTQNNEHFFGLVKNNQMELSAIGQIAHDCWLEIPQHFSFVSLDRFIIMPNHLHGIIFIKKDNNQRAKHKNQFGPQSQNLASVVRGFKAGVTTQARKINTHFSWHNNYYENIIRNRSMLENLSLYTLNNPKTWPNDKFYNGGESTGE